MEWWNHLGVDGQSGRCELFINLLDDRDRSVGDRPKKTYWVVVSTIPTRWSCRRQPVNHHRPDPLVERDQWYILQESQSFKM